jgi:Zn-dependent metalloprotease
MKSSVVVSALVAMFGVVQCGGAIAASTESRPSAGRRAIESFKQHLKAKAQLAGVADDSLDDDDELETSGVVVDDDGQEHVRLHRRYKGLRVVGGDVVVHGDASGQLKDISRTWRRKARLDVKASVASADAAQSALKAFKHRHGKVGGRELIVWAVDGKEQLAWDVSVQGQQLDGTPSEAHLIVHAGTGRVLAQWDDVHTTMASANGNALYAGWVDLKADLASGLYRLQDASRGGHYVADVQNKTDFRLFTYSLLAKQVTVTSTTGVFGDGTTGNRSTAAAEAAYGFQMTWDYFTRVHQRNGLDGSGGKIYSRVHYGTNYNNAFWQASCTCMTYGDGDGSTFKSMISLDVAAHEMSHGVTAKTAGLIYTGESGGLNEATSDIFGAMVEFYANNSKDVGDYLVGEKLAGPKLTRGYLRTMVNPSDDGSSADCWYANVGKLDVHASSGLGNHVFYLMAEGTSAGAPSRTCAATDTRVASGRGSVQGIGRDKAERVWYRALTTYMTSNTNFAGARQATIKASNDLFGSGSNETSAIMAAWAAVNVN